jgi:hypothetical protein
VVVTVFARVALAVLVVSTASACKKSAPKVPGPIAWLETPAPPARLVTPVELPVFQAPEPEGPAVAPAAPTPPRREAPSAAKPTDKPATPPAEATPPPVLRSVPDTAAAERKIQQFLASAQQSLNSISYRELSANARAQYDQASTFIRMANDALKTKNYPYAEQLASRAASMAGLLVKG